MGRQFSSWRNNIKLQCRMNTILIFLLTLGSCSEPTAPYGVGPKYQGYEQNIPRAFVANYMCDVNSGQFVWLESPVVFKLNVERDTMFMYTSGKGYVFPRIKDSMKCYSGFVGQTHAKITVLTSAIEVEMPDCRKLRILNKSMI